jgi:hypothetical protein
MRKVVFPVALLFIFLFLIVSPAFTEDIKPCTLCVNEVKEEDKKFSAFSDEIAPPWLFADIGHAMKHRETLCMLNQFMFDGIVLVHDYHTADLIDIQKAHFVKDGGITTPGGLGIVAFKDHSSAEKFVSANGGKIISYDDLMEMSF